MKYRSPIVAVALLRRPMNSKLPGGPGPEMTQLPAEATKAVEAALDGNLKGGTVPKENCSRPWWAIKEGNF